jgi:hypothetical protein
LKHIKFKRRKLLDPSDFVKRPAKDKDYKTLIKENCIIYENDKPIIIYLVAHEIPESFVKVVREVEFHKHRRVAGLRTNARIFGYIPREQIRRDFCSSTSFSVDDPKRHQAVCDFGKTLSEYYQKYCPEIFSQHMKETDKISPSWKIEGTPFTSGIINNNMALKYHYDGGNINHVYSNMVALKRYCKGGHLALPEFNLGLEIADRSLLFFDGQDIIHGVTPFEIKHQGGFRYTLVYYTLKRMWQCLPIDEEMARIKRRKTIREINRYKRLTGEIPNEIVVKSK